MNFLFGMTGKIWEKTYRFVVRKRHVKAKYKKSMKPYLNRNGDSGVLAYEYGTDWIRLRFAGGKDKEYEYAETSIGARNLETMKRLANSGDGLTTFINTHPEVKNGYI